MNTSAADSIIQMLLAVNIAGVTASSAAAAQSAVPGASRLMPANAVVNTALRAHRFCGLGFLSFMS